MSCRTMSTASAAAPPALDLTAIQTETRNQRSTLIDKVSTQELCQIINDEDKTIPGVVEACIPTIAQAIDALADRVRNGGRIFYIGAGTSGRLGVLDASEIPPTYSAPPEQFVGLIAGGDVALRSAIEGAEDDAEAALKDLKMRKVDGEKDCLIGIAASGRTPYVLGGLAFAKSQGCATVGVACSTPSAMGRSGDVDFMIEAVTGAEVVTGSTRMKAGTATKLVLNMISTGVMIKVGKTYGNIVSLHVKEMLIEVTTETLQDDRRQTYQRQVEAACSWNPSCDLWRALSCPERSLGRHIGGVRQECEVGGSGDLVQCSHRRGTETSR